jgi:hypothetical protein
MAVAPSKNTRGSENDGARLSISDLVLLRIACGGASRAELQRDLAGIVAPRVSGTQFRRAAELAIGQHANRGYLLEAKGRLSLTAAGLRAAEGIVPAGRIAQAAWDDLRSRSLIALVLGVNPESAAIAKALERADSLAALVVQRHFGLATSRVLSINDLRAALAVIALERAFGNKIKTGLAKGSGLPGKTARLLAGQLLRKPREFSSDGKLIQALAAEAAGAQAEGLEPLRLALLRKLTTPADAEGVAAARESPAASDEPDAPRADNDAAPLPANPPSMGPPDMTEFASAVLDAARPVSQGWPGNRKAFISQVWQAIRIARRDWDLTEIAFKTMLAEGHRMGQLVLATADLKDKSARKELEDSKILYKNTVWHFVRVED